MDDNDGGSRLEARPPTRGDLVRICTALNERSARYVLIGGFAVNAHGAGRTTKDIDFLIDVGRDNVALVKAALGVLEDNAAAEVADDDLERYPVVRIADEVVVDLLASACGVTYSDAISDAVQTLIDGVSIPVASATTLIRTKLS